MMRASGLLMMLCFLIWISLCENSSCCTLRIYALVCELYFSKIFIFKNNIWASICECTVQKFGKVNFGMGLIKKDWLRKVNFEIQLKNVGGLKQ